MTAFSQSELEAYLDEALAVEEMARIERALRDDRRLAEQLAVVHARRNAGVHSLGEIWRRHRLSCPTREQLGSYLLGVVADDHSRYIAFHVEVAGCRWCQANLADLKAQQTEAGQATEVRRKKYLQSSAGYLASRGSRDKSPE